MTAQFDYPTATEYFDTLPAVAPVLEQLLDLGSPAADGLMLIRQRIYDESSSAMPLKYRELTFVTLAIVAGQHPTAMAHLRRAVDAGLTRDELRDMLLVTVLGHGVFTWSSSGSLVWSDAQELFA